MKPTSPFGLINISRIKLSHTLLLVTAAFLFSTKAYSQRHQMEKIQAEKMAFITSELDLTSRESQLFWPVYNEFEKKRNSLLEERRDLTSQFRHNRDKMSASEISELVDRFVELRAKDSELHKEYHEKFKEVISAERVMLLYLAEEEFRGQLLRRLRRGPPRDH